MLARRVACRRARDPRAPAVFLRAWDDDVARHVEPAHMFSRARHVGP